MYIETCVNRFSFYVFGEERINKIKINVSFI